MSMLHLQNFEINMFYKYLSVHVLYIYIYLNISTCIPMELKTFAKLH